MHNSRKYQSASKSHHLRQALAELPTDSNFSSLRPAVKNTPTAGKILKNSRKGAPKLEEPFLLGSSRRSQRGREAMLTGLELKKSRLLEELKAVEGKIEEIKEEGSRAKFYETAVLKIADGGATHEINYKSLTYINSRILETLAKQIVHETELRTWKLKMPKQYQQQAFKILIQKHKIPASCLTVEFDEFDPFVQTDCSIDRETFVNQIYLNYAKCQQHWKNYAANRFDKDEVKALFSKLDFDKQGTICLKHFVREMSILLNKNLRTRDLFRIFKRIVEQEDQFTCTLMLKALSRKSSHQI